MKHSWGRLRLSGRTSSQGESSGGSSSSGSLVENQESGEGSTPDPDGGSDDQGDDEDGGLPKDVQFDVLKNRRRRLVLGYLFEHEAPVSIGTLAEHVAGVENDKEPRALDSQERKRAYVGLYQCHLPRMDDADVVDFDKDRGQVEPGQYAETLRQHVEPATGEWLGWPKVYLGLSGLGLGSALVVSSGLVGASPLGGAVLGVAFAAIAGVAAVQLRRQRDDT